MRILLRILITAFIVVALSNFLSPHLAIKSFGTGVWVAIVLGLMNIFVKPVLILFTLPVTVFTFGLFVLAINAFIVMLCSSLVSGFYVEGFWWALLFSLLLSICQSILFATFQDRRKNPRL